jgi:hypothetical protein
MSETATLLRDKLHRLGQAKREAAAEDLRLHLSLSPSARLVVTLAHCDAHIAAFGDRDLSLSDDDAACWTRIRRRLTHRG